MPHRAYEGTLTSVLSTTQINSKPGENANPLSIGAQEDEEKQPMEVTEDRSRNEFQYFKQNSTTRQGAI